MWRMRGMPFKKWPRIDQDLFTAGLNNSSRYTPGGPTSKKAEDTKNGWRCDYGIGLNWLHQNGLLDESAHPASRWTSEILDRLVGYMVSLDYSAVAIHTRLCRIKRSLQIMKPDSPLEYFDAIRRELDPPKPRFDPIVLKVDSRQLKKLGLDLMKDARGETDVDAKDRADKFRTGLQIALIASRPWRRRTFTLMILWKHLRKIDNAWRMEAAPEDTKNRRGLKAWVPKDLNAAANDYVLKERPTLCKGAEALTNALWVTKKGEKQTDKQFYREYCRRTRERFGTHVTLQATRKIAATTIALNRPEHVRAIQAILGQSGPEVGEQYYNFAMSIAALDDLSDVIDENAEHSRSTRKRP